MSVSPPPPPSAPSGLSATGVSTSRIDLVWLDNSGDEDGFDIERSPDGTVFSFLTSVGANTSSHSDLGLDENTTYWYRVRAFNGSGNSTYSNVANATTTMAGSIDYRATSDLGGQGTVSGNFVATQANDGVTQSITERLSGGKPVNRHSYLRHSWTFSVAPAGSLTFHVNAWHSPSGDGDDFDFAWSSDNSSYTNMVTATDTSDTGNVLTFALPPSLSGTVYIRVTDTDQSQGNQGLDTVFVDDMFIRSAGAGMSPPVAPSGLSASVDSTTSIAVGWSDNSSDEDGFELERSTDGTSFSLLVTASANQTSHLDVGLTPGQTYYYRVRAFNANGNSSYSDTDSATPGSNDDVAQSENNVDGNVQQGSYLDTRTADGAEEEIREARTGGPPSQRITFLEHVWTFNVTGGSAVSFHLEAFKSTTSDNDDFEFSYSTNGGVTYLPMLTVANTTNIGPAVFALPASTSGTVMVRVVDTDRTPGSNDRDSIFVDQMFFRSQ